MCLPLQAHAPLHLRILTRAGSLMLEVAQGVRVILTVTWGQSGMPTICAAESPHNSDPPGIWLPHPHPAPHHEGVAWGERLIIIQPMFWKSSQNCH